MNLLILGGTRFLGRHTAEAALAAGHRVTVFHRGKTGATLFPNAEHLIGDRARDLHLLEARQWDAVVDTSGYLPGVVRESAERLRPQVGHYVFVSSISAYADLTAPGLDESAPLSMLTPEQRKQAESFDRSEPRNSPDFLPLYGALKTACEDVVQEIFGERCAIVRPGLIIGPDDYMDRFPYWVSRIAAGGDVLAPGRPDRLLQVIDSRDIGAWMVRLAGNRTPGAFNTTGPSVPIPFVQVLEACRAASGSDARFVWVDDAFLLAREVGPWEEMPLWIPTGVEGFPAGFLQVDVRRAVAAGLTFRPLVESARDTLVWERTRPAEAPRRAGLGREKERALLEAWKSEAQAGRA